MIFDDIAFSLPSRSFFDVPSAPDPLTLPPPSGEPSFKAPFAIDPTIYNKALSPQIPITFAVVYFTFATVCNAINRRRGNKPFGVSKTLLFKVLVLLHNLALAIYSGITCAALVRTLYVSWPGWQGTHGLSGAVDALCKLHGPRGFGDAVTYDPWKLKWTTGNQMIHLGADRLTPDSTDVGRIWNEGLAFWGWLFYLSKYYEVVDTIIILLKGKRATTLQKYHHAGALLCMWAGIRYMSPPIWMFVLVNSGIHTLMYTFYTASTLGIRAPRSIKRTITTLQILQFVVGTVFASAHLFISYKIPVSIPYSLWSTMAGAARVAPSTVSDILSSTKLTSGSVNIPAWLKRLAYRAAGAEGLAERVRDHVTDPFAYRDIGRSQRKPFDEPQSPTRDYSRHSSHRSDMVPCLDTNGQSFAIWLNVAYLMPLTLLFLRFFWKSYIMGNRVRPAGPDRSPRRVSEAAEYAVQKTSDTFEEYGVEFEKSIGFVSDELQDGGEDSLVRETVDSVRQGLSDARKDLDDRFSDVVADIRKKTDDIVGVEQRGVSTEQGQTVVKNGDNSDKKAAQKAKGDFGFEGGEVVRTPSKSKRTNGRAGDNEQVWFTSSSSGSRTQTQRTSSSQISSSTAQQDSWTDIRDEDAPDLDNYLGRREERRAMGEGFSVDFDGRIVEANGREETEQAGPTSVEVVQDKKEDPSWGFGLNG